MECLKRFLERLYDTHITNNDDAVVLVIGDEGAGKSTWMLQAIWLYNAHRGITPTPENTLSHVIFDDRDAFRERLLHATETDPISIMDAAHVLYRKETMNPDQIESEKSLLDMRFGNYLLLLGYQDWADIPDILQRRRAEYAIRIPRRGIAYGYNRKQLDEKYSSYGRNEWPEPALRDTFPSLEGTSLWTRFEEVDTERKRARLQTDDDETTDLTPQDVVEDILNGDPGDYIDHNEFQERTYFSKPMIRYDYPDLSGQQADQVRAALRRNVNLDDYAPEGGDTHTPTPQE